MPSPYPNHLVSIPNSIVSLKHYFRVHDQAFGRTLVYLLILGVLITGVFLAIGLIEYSRYAPKEQARQSAEIAKRLADVAFANGRATSKLKQPCLLWQDFVEPPEGEKTDEKKERPRQLIVVLDTTGKLKTWQQAADFAGCGEHSRIIVFRKDAILFHERPAARGEKAVQETYPYTDAAKLEEIRKLLEEKGATMPVEVKDGKPTFDLEDGKVHVVASSGGLLVLCDTTEKGLSVEQATNTAYRENPKMIPPEGLALVGATDAILKYRYEPGTRTLAYKSLPKLDAAAVADWIPAAFAEARWQSLMGGLMPNSLKMLFMVCFQLLLYALICSVAGLVANVALRAGLSYTSILTMAVYALTPASLLMPLLIRAAGASGDWVGVLPFVVGMGYTALATHRTARELAAAPAPSL